MVWILGRTYCTGTPEDYKAVHALQDKYSLVPLSAYGKDYMPPKGKVDPNIDMKTPVREQVNRMDAGAYFKLLAALMKDNPPTKEDAPMVEKMAKIGIVPGKDFDISKLDPAVAKGPARRPRRRGSRRSWATSRTRGTHANGWMFTTKTGIYGTDYLQRAFVTAIGLGANRPQDAVYPTSEADGDGKPYERRQQVRHALRQGPDAAGQRLLVADHVQRRLLLRRQRAQQVHASALATRSSTTTTARWTSTSRMNRRARTRKRTGCRRPRTSSS